MNEVNGFLSAHLQSNIIQRKFLNIGGSYYFVFYNEQSGKWKLRSLEILLDLTEIMKEILP